MVFVEVDLRYGISFLGYTVVGLDMWFLWKLT
jgi:hypothetical protein